MRRAQLHENPAHGGARRAHRLGCRPHDVGRVRARSRHPRRTGGGQSVHGRLPACRAARRREHRGRCALRQRQGRHLPLQERRPAQCPAAGPDGRWQRQRHLGLDRPVLRQGVRDRRPHQRHRVRRRQHAHRAEVPGQPAVQRRQQLVARHEGLQGPRVHRRRRHQRPRHAGLRPHPAADHHDAADAHGGRAVQGVRPGAQHRHQRGDRVRLRDRLQHVQRRPAHGRHPHAEAAEERGLRRSGRVHARQPVRDLPRTGRRPTVAGRSASTPTRTR